MKPFLSATGAIGLAIAGFTFWVLADTSIKLAGRSRLPAYEVIAFLGLFIAGFLVIRGLLRRDLAALRPTQPGRQLVRSCLDLGNNLCVVVALRHLTLTLFYILVFLAPMVITILTAIFLREALHWRKALAVLTGFAGVVVAVDPWGTARQGDWIGYAACMVCVACFSVNMVWSRVLTRTERPESLTFSSGVVMAVVGFGLMLWHAEPITPHLTLILLAMGFFCTMGTLCFFFALTHTSPATVSQYHYTQLVSGALVTWILWRERPTVWMMLGGILIIGSGLYIALAASREQFRALSISPVVPD